MSPKTILLTLAITAMDTNSTTTKVLHQTTIKRHKYMREHAAGVHV